MGINWRAAAGFLISGALVWWLVAKSGIDWSASWDAAVHANKGLLALSAVVATCVIPLRARRWQTLLDPVAPGLPMGPLWRATAIGVMANNVAPARAGELVRAYALSREAPEVSFSTAVASIGLDRVFDGIVVLLLLLAAVIDPHFPATAGGAGFSFARAAAVSAAGIGGVLLVLYGLVFFPAQVLSALERVASAVMPRLSRRIVDAARKFAEGLGVLRSPRRFAAVLWWAFALWMLQPVAFWLAFRAFGIEGPWTMALFAQGVMVLSVALPSSPGFVGVFEAGAISALAVYGIDRDLAAAWALAYHVVSFVPITLIGLYYFLRMGLSFSQARSAQPAPQP